MCPILPSLQEGDKWAPPLVHACFLPQPAPAAAMVPGKKKGPKVAALDAPETKHTPIHGKIHYKWLGYLQCKKLEMAILCNASLNQYIMVLLGNNFDVIGIYYLASNIAFDVIFIGQYGVGCYQCQPLDCIPSRTQLNLIESTRIN